MIGTLASLAAGHAVSGQLFGVRSPDPLTFGGVALLRGSVAVLATLLPARRAARVEPVVALRVG